MSIANDYNAGYAGYRPNSQTSSLGPNRFREGNLGHPGKYTAVKNIAASTNASFTGSKWGGAAVMFGRRTGQGGAAATKIFFTGGGMVTLQDLGATSGSLYEFSVKEIHNGAGGTVTVFSKRNSGIGGA